MKNEATTPQASDDGARPCGVRPRAPAPRRRRADPPRLRRRPRGARAVGSANGVEPERRRLPRPAQLRRPARRPRRRRRAPSPASLRRSVRSSRAMVELGEMTANPADLLPRPKPTQRCPRRSAGGGRGAAEPDPGDHAARAARPRDVRARLRLRAARGGARATWTSSRSTLTPNKCVWREGRQDPLRAGRRARVALRRALSRARPPGLAGADAEPALLLSKSGRRLSTSDVRRRLRVWARHAARREAFTRMPCATRSRPICSRAAPICARSRSCSATRASPQPRSTLG